MTPELRFIHKLFESSRKAIGCRLANAAIRIGLVTASFFCQGCLVLPMRAPDRTNGNSGAMEKIQPGFHPTQQNHSRGSNCQTGRHGYGNQRQTAFPRPLG
jgi:hypothetical protein